MGAFRAEHKERGGQAPAWTDHCAQDIVRCTMCQNTRAIALLVLPLIGCDPCGATLNCTGAPRVAVVGQIVDDNSGAPVGSASVMLQRQSGVMLEPLNAATTSTSDGAFELELPASTVGDAFVSLTVAAPGRPSYVVPDIRLTATTTSGSATVLQPWAAGRPHFPFVLIVYRDFATEQGAADATVEFRRTAGPLMMSGDTPVDTIRGTTDGVGWLYLFRDIRADRAGVVTGDLLIWTSGDTLTLPQVTWEAVPRFKQPTLPVVVIIGSI
jgi:hypothetical protein